VGTTDPEAPSLVARRQLPKRGLTVRPCFLLGLLREFGGWGALRLSEERGQHAFEALALYALAAVEARRGGNAPIAAAVHREALVLTEEWELRPLARRCRARASE
jgi:hypothetical protein